MLVGARPRGRAWSAPTCSPRTAGSSARRVAAINDHAADDIRVLVVGNPANTNALIAAASAPECARGAIHRDDPARPQPRSGSGGRQARRRRRAPRPDDDLGQSLDDPGSRMSPQLLRGRRARGDLDPTWVRRRVHPRGGAPRRRDHRRSRIIVGRSAPRTPPSTTCATGTPAPRRGTRTSVVFQRGEYGVPEGWCARSPPVSTEGVVGRAGTRARGPDARSFDASVAELEPSATPCAPRPAGLGSPLQGPESTAHCSNRIVFASTISDRSRDRLVDAVLDDLDVFALVGETGVRRRGRSG